MSYDRLRGNRGQVTVVVARGFTMTRHILRLAAVSPNQLSEQSPAKGNKQTNRQPPNYC